MYTEKKAEIQQFFNAWTVYSTALDNNYMFHNEIFHAIGNLLSQYFTEKTYKLVDLGCGDASFLARAIKNTGIDDYTGYDLSQPALEIAAQNIKPLGCEMTLIQDDFMAGLAQTNRRYDVIFTSFAVHHLDTAEKAKFFQLARAALADDGFLLLVDTMRDPDQTLPDYLDAYCQWLESTWDKLDPEQKASACQHIRNNDLPETESTLRELAMTAGFTDSQTIGAWSWHRALRFTI